jgi:hypothetical protein
VWVDHSHYRLGVRWSDVEDAEPALVSAIRSRFAAHRHHVLATLAPDGRPRQWGTEVGFHDGELWIGMPSDTAKFRDLARDPRCSLHCAPIDLDMIEGDAVVEADARLLEARSSREWIARHLDGVVPEAARVALLEPARLRLVTVSGDELVSRVWSPGSGLVEHRRR